MKPVLIVDARGNALLRCASRAELLRDPRCQRILAAIASTTAFCGCSNPPIPLAILEEDNHVWATKEARVGKRRLHAESCGAIEPRPAAIASTPAPADYPADVKAAERAFAQAYRRQFSSPELSLVTFCRWVDEAVREQSDGVERPVFGQGASTAITDNVALPEAFDSAVGLHEVAVHAPDASGSLRAEYWRIAPGELYGPTQPDGRSILGVHLVRGLNLTASPRWLRLWVMPVVVTPTETGYWVHPVWSNAECTLGVMLAAAKLPFFKPPMALHPTMVPEGDWRDILTMLAEAKVRPQTIVRLLTGKYCVVEVSRTDEFGYRMRLLAKVDRLAALEDRHGLEWAVLRPWGHGFKIDFRSRALALADLLTANREPGAAEPPPPRR